MRNRMYGGVRGRKTRVGEKLHRFPPTRLCICKDIKAAWAFLPTPIAYCGRLISPAFRVLHGLPIKRGNLHELGVELIVKLCTLP